MKLAYTLTIAYQTARRWSRNSTAGRLPSHCHKTLSASPKDRNRNALDIFHSSELILQVKTWRNLLSLTRKSWLKIGNYILHPEQSSKDGYTGPWSVHSVPREINEIGIFPACLDYETWGRDRITNNIRHGLRLSSRRGVWRNIGATDSSRFRTPHL